MSDDENKPNNPQPQEDNAIQTQNLDEESEWGNLPPEAKRVIQMAVSTHKIGLESDPIAEKLTETHISTLLESSEKSDQRAFEYAKMSRKYGLVYVLISVVLFVFLTVYLVDIDKELWKKVVKLFAVFAGGFGGGFGVKSYLDRNQ